MQHGATTLGLIRGAREGDSNAWSALLERFYQDWLDRFHGDLGTTIRRLYDTVDLVQSAVGDVLRALPSLNNEKVFFAWVTAIIRHKIADRKRRLRRERPALAGDRLPEPAAAPSDSPEERAVEDAEVYARTLDAILALFPDHPEAMAAVFLKVLDDQPIRAIAERLGLPERTVFRRIEKGIELLRQRLGER
jgi:RNA polymerase sigma factor (sigma-70 family)